MEVFYNLQAEELCLVKATQIKNMHIMTTYKRERIYEIRCNEFYFYIHKYEGGIYYVESIPNGIEFCLKNGIILSVESKNTLDYSCPMPVYGVKFSMIWNFEHIHKRKVIL